MKNIENLGSTPQSINNTITPSGDSQSTSSPNTQNTESNQTKSENDNVVFVGSKHLMNYVNSIEMQLKSNQEVIIKARGKFISKAVDVVEVAKRHFQEQNMSVKDIKINTEEYENEGKKVKVSTIDLILTK